MTARTLNCLSRTVSETNIFYLSVTARTLNCLSRTVSETNIFYLSVTARTFVLAELSPETCIFSVWQHVRLSWQIRPRDRLACWLDVKQPPNNNNITPDRKMPLIGNTLIHTGLYISFAIAMKFTSPRVILQIKMPTRSDLIIYQKEGNKPKIKHKKSNPTPMCWQNPPVSHSDQCTGSADRLKEWTVVTERIKSIAMK